MKDYLKIVGNNIKQIREMKGMSQQQLAIKCGHTTDSARSWISKIESGERSTHTDDLAVIANALDVPPSTLYVEFETTSQEALYNRLYAYLEHMSKFEKGE